MIPAEPAAMMLTGTKDVEGVHVGHRPLGDQSGHLQQVAAHRNAKAQRELLRSKRNQMRRQAVSASLSAIASGQSASMSPSARISRRARLSGLDSGAR